MNDIEYIKTELAEFIKVDKFEKYKDLQPAVENSTDGDKAFVNAELNSCCNELLEHLLQKKPIAATLKKIVRNSLDKIKDQMLDTEDEEFAYELYYKIGEILGIDLADKNITVEQAYLKEFDRIVKKAGIDLSKFLPPNSSADNS